MPASGPHTKVMISDLSHLYACVKAFPGSYVFKLELFVVFWLFYFSTAAVAETCICVAYLPVPVSTICASIFMRVA